jgi:acetolactate synthase-1/2/3 large subunit
VIKLADRCGALLSNTLPARGLFHDHPFGLGITGSYFTSLGREMYESADVVLAVGTSLSYYIGGGHFWPKAYKIQLDDAPRGLRDGLKAADLYVKSDALVGAEAILAGLDKKLGVGKPTAAAIRTKELAHRIATEPADSMEFDTGPGVLDPRKVIEALDAVIPKDWDIVVGGGHYFSIAMTHMKGRPAEKYHVINDFGAIGSGLPAAVGVAVARGDGKVLLIEGDGSLMMHIQELETIRRHGVQMLIAIMNDGGYGAEFHKFRANKIDPSGAIHGRGDIAAAATGLGLRGATVNQMGKMEGLFREHRAANIASLWDIHTDDLIPSRSYRRVHYGEA